MVQEKEFLTFEESSESDVVIVLMGWGAAQLRHIAKFHDKYRERKYSMLTFLAPLTSILDLGVPASYSACVANRLHEYYENLSEDRKSKMKIFVHAFSNTGYYAMHTFEGLLETDRFAHLSNAYIGRIMDSCPGHTGLNKIPIPDELKSLLKAQAVSKNGDDVALQQESLYNNVALTYPETLGKMQSSLKLDDEYDLTYLPHYNVKQSFLISLAAVSCILKKNTYVHPFWSPLAIFAISVLLTKEKLWKAYCAITCSPKVSLYEHLVNGSLESYNADLEKAACLPRQAVYRSPPPLPGMPIQPAVVKEKDLDEKDERAALLTEVTEKDIQSFKDHARGVRSFDFLTRKYLNSAALASDPHRPLPELYLYGPKDLLIPDFQVEKVIFARTVQNEVIRREGKEAPLCMAIKFEDSPHVSHFRVHPEVYFKAVFSFIDQVEEKHL